MRKKKRMNDKGFSLVEVIVVMAIIGILTVTLTPRLTQYIEKAKKASDQDVVNTIYTVAKLADVLNPIENNYEQPLGGNSETAAKAIYTINGNTWTLNKYSESGDSATDVRTGFTREYIQELMASLDSFKLKAKEAGKNTQIYVGKNNDGELYVRLKYDTSKTGADDYIVPDGTTAATITP